MAWWQQQAHSFSIWRSLTQSRLLSKEHSSLRWLKALYGTVLSRLWEAQASSRGTPPANKHKSLRIHRSADSLLRRSGLKDGRQYTSIFLIQRCADSSEGYNPQAFTQTEVGLISCIAINGYWWRGLLNNLLPEMNRSLHAISLWLAFQLLVEYSLDKIEIAISHICKEDKEPKQTCGPNEYLALAVKASFRVRK